MNRTESNQNSQASDRVFLSVLRSVPAELSEQLDNETQLQREPMVLKLPSQAGTQARRPSVLQQVLEKLQPLRKVACIALLLSLAASTAFAQGSDGTYVIGGEYSGSARSIAIPENPGVGGMGVLGRIGHEAGSTIGRDESITTFDVSPFMFFEETMVFGEGRLFIVNSGRVGGSAGVGARRFFLEKNAIAGLSFFYDRDDSRGGGAFEQFGVSGEIFTEWLDVRGNVYMPFGSKEQTLRTVFATGTEQFVGNNIQFQTRTTTANALEGGDLMFTVPVPGEIPEMMNLEASAGFYHFQARGQASNHIYGYKLRADIDILEKLSHMFLEVSNDKVFKTNVVFGADINYRGDQESRPRLGKSQYNRISQWVRRNRHVAARLSTTLDAPQLAINPDTGNPYLVYHVRNNPDPPPINFPAPLGNGSIDMPFQFINEAIDEAPEADIVFVHGNSVFDASVIPNINATAVMRENLLVLGEGVPLTIPVNGIIDEIPLPSVTAGAVNRPLITNVTGPVVTLADNSRFAGFEITNVDGPAIVGTGVNGSIVNEVNITNTTGATGHGIFLTDNSGQFTFENINISNTSADAFHVERGTANIVFEGTNTIVDSAGYSVFVQDASGSVNMRGTAITSNGGLGILVQGTPGNTSTANVTIGSATLNNAPGNAILIDNHSAAVSFLDDVVIDASGDDSIVVQQLGANGSVNFQGNTTVSNRTGVGVLIDSINEGPDPLVVGGTRAGIVSFQQDLSINGFAIGNTDPGLLFNSPTGQLSLVGNTQISGSGGTGFEVSNIANTGVSTGQIVSTGLISIDNTAGDAMLLNNVDKIRFQVFTNGIAIDDRGGIGIHVEDYAGETRLSGVNTIDNQLLSLAPAIVVQNNPGVIGFGDTSVTDAIGPVGVLVDNNLNRDLNTLPPNTIPPDAEVAFSELSVEGTPVAGGSIGVVITDNRNVSVAGGILDMTNAQAIQVLRNGFDTLRVDRGTPNERVVPVVTEGHSLTFDEVSATNAAFGIEVRDSTGEFIVTGNNGNDGGTISGMTIAGALFQNTQVADLAFQTYENNAVGLQFEEMIRRVAAPLPIGTELPIPTNSGYTPFVRLQNMVIDDSTNEGIFGLNVSTFSLLDSQMNDNGVAGNDNQIELVATLDEVDFDFDGNDDAVNYLYIIDNNVISDPTNNVTIADMILIRTQGIPGDGAELDLFITNNGARPGAGGLISNRALSAVVNVDWEGDFATTIQNNVFLLSDAGNQTAVQLDIDGPADVLFDNNSVSTQGINDTGLNFTFAESAAVNITNNFQLDDQGLLIAGSGFLFSDVGATAMEFEFNGTNNDINIDSNLIEFAQTSTTATAMLFNRIFGPSNVAINNNEINFAQFNNNQNVIFFTTERGIIFQDVRGSINLNGADDNIMRIDTTNPFAIDFSIPVGASTGSIIINGTPRP